MNYFPDYKHLLQENYVEYKLFFNVTQLKKFFLQHISIVSIVYVCISRSFLVTSVCNQGKTLCSPCIMGARKAGHVTSRG
jgi:hypothetical protein